MPNRIKLRADLELIFVVRGHILMKRVPELLRIIANWRPKNLLSLPAMLYAALAV